MQSFIHLLIAPLCLAATTIAPTWLPTRRWFPARHPLEIALTAFILGAATQGLLGLFWNHVVSDYPRGVTAIYYGGWLLASACAVRSRRKPVEWPSARECGLLLLIASAALAVRWIHPLQTAELGQSDAYSHLQFIHQVVADGHVHNRIYPAAFSWIMAWPTLTFGVDPYWTARFGGALWGLVLTMAVFLLAREKGGVLAGSVAASLVAVFPLWIPLIKTGVGLFANQAGLSLLPLIALHYVRMERRAAVRGFELTALLLLLSALVPMMLIGLLPALLLDALIALASGEKECWRRMLRRGRVMLPAMALLLWQTTRIEGAHRAATLTIVTEGSVTMPSSEPSKPEAADTIEPAKPAAGRVALLRHYLEIKRWGFGTAPLNGAAVTLILLFVSTLAWGWRTRDETWRWMGAWGAIASLQSATGMLQFAGYQREGWSLLIVLAWTAGAGSVILTQKPFGGRWLRSCMSAVLIGGAVYAFRFPPGHKPGYSVAESEIVETARLFAIRNETEAEDRTLWIVARAFTGFHGHQGDPIMAVVGHYPATRRLVVNTDSDVRRTLKGNDVFLFIIEEKPPSESGSGGLFAHVQPDQVRHFKQSRRHLFAANKTVRDGLQQMATQGWRLEPQPSSTALSITWVYRLDD